MKKLNLGVMSVFIASLLVSGISPAHAIPAQPVPRQPAQVRDISAQPTSDPSIQPSAPPVNDVAETIAEYHKLVDLLSAQEKAIVALADDPVNKQRATDIDKAITAADKIVSEYKIARDKKTGAAGLKAIEVRYVAVVKEVSSIAVHYVATVRNVSLAGATVMKSLGGLAADGQDTFTKLQDPKFRSLLETDQVDILNGLRLVQVALAPVEKAQNYIHDMQEATEQIVNEAVQSGKLKLGPDGAPTDEQFEAALLNAAKIILDIKTKSANVPDTRDNAPSNK